MYVCMYAYVCMYVCLYAYLCMSVCLSVCLYVCICMFVCLCMHVCMSVCMYVYMYVCMSVCLSVCMYVCICMYVCMHMYVCMPMYACLYVCRLQARQSTARKGESRAATAIFLRIWTSMVKSVPPRTLSGAPAIIARHVVHARTPFTATRSRDVSTSSSSYTMHTYIHTYP